MALAYVIVILLVATLAQVTKTGPIRSSPHQVLSHAHEEEGHPEPTRQRRTGVQRRPTRAGVPLPHARAVGFLPAALAQVMNR